MGTAAVWGAIGALALVLGAAVSYLSRPSPRVIAIVMALGTGVLFGAISYDLVQDALDTAQLWKVATAMLIGALAFTVGDWLLMRGGARKRKSPRGEQADASALAIVLGSVLDGIPESFVLGMSVRQGAVSVSLLFGVLLSNFPEGMASSSGLRASGWPARKTMGMWGLVVLASAASAALGYAALGGGRTGAMMQAFAGGALLAMLADTMLPEAYKEEGVRTGFLVAAGFALALALGGAG